MEIVMDNGEKPESTLSRPGQAALRSCDRHADQRGIADRLVRAIGDHRINHPTQNQFDDVIFGSSIFVDGRAEGFSATTRDKPGTTISF